MPKAQILLFTYLKTPTSWSQIIISIRSEIQLQIFKSVNKKDAHITPLPYKNS